MTRPNILILMVDQLAGTLFPDGPAPFLHAPNLARLAERSTRFANAYTASPLCAPARASFMSGQLPSRTGVYDNAAEFASDLPTFAHHLRRAGYATCLSRQDALRRPRPAARLRGAADHRHLPGRLRLDPRLDRSPSAASTGGTTTSARSPGPAPPRSPTSSTTTTRSPSSAAAKLYDLARQADPRPWCLTVSFTHPHDPYVARPRHWDLYADCPALDPAVPPIPFAEQDPHTQRLLAAADHAAFAITPEHVRRARRGYFAAISYVDEKIGELLGLLDRLGLAAGTAIALPLRPRRHARRARPLVQDELPRGLGPRAADARRARASPRAASTARSRRSTSCRP